MPTRRTPVTPQNPPCWSTKAGVQGTGARPIWKVVCMISRSSAMGNKCCWCCLERLVYGECKCKCHGFASAMPFSEAFFLRAKFVSGSLLLLMSKAAPPIKAEHESCIPAGTHRLTHGNTCRFADPRIQITCYHRSPRIQV